MDRPVHSVWRGGHLIEWSFTEALDADAALVARVLPIPEAEATRLLAD